MPENEKVKLEDIRKLIFGAIVFGAGVALSLTGSAALGQQLIWGGIAIVVGGNLFDKFKK